VRAAEAAAGKVAPAKARATKPTAGRRQHHLDDLAERLGDKLNTRVKIALGTAKGTISIEFATVADLNRIVEELGVTPQG
jgi:ParB family chromosome partitioning protein